VTIPDEFPTFLPVARLDTEQTKRVDDDLWRRECLQAQAEIIAMEAEHKRDKSMYFAAGFLIGLAVPVGYVGSLITRLFGG
jgi:hypothetical protein